MNYQLHSECYAGSYRAVSQEATSSGRNKKGKEKKKKNDEKEEEESGKEKKKEAMRKRRKRAMERQVGETIILEKLSEHEKDKLNFKAALQEAKFFHPQCFVKGKFSSHEVLLHIQK